MFNKKIFPNNKVASRIFRIADDDKNNKISFSEFMKYIFLLLEGTKEKKSKFIFDMICIRKKDFFEFEDLFDFYRIVNYENEENFLNEDFLEEEDMTRIVFGMMRKNINEKINLDEFQDFINKDDNHVNLFNFLNGDAESSRKDIRMKRSFLVLINIIESLITDIEFLEDIIYGEKEIFKKENNFERKFSNRFTQAFNDIVKDKLKVDTTIFKTKKNRKSFLQKNKSLFKKGKMENLKKQFGKNNKDNSIDEIIDYKVYSETIKKTNFNTNKNLEEKTKDKKKNFDINFIESEKSIEIKKANPTFSWNNRNFTKTNHNIQKIIKKIKNKAEKVKTSLEKEIDFISKKENLSINLKNLTDKKKTDRKKKIFLNDPNWNLVTTMISGIYKSINIIDNDKYHILNKSDFKIRNKIELHPIYSNLFKKCKFKDYAPHVFENIRRQFGINSESYLKSIGINTFKNAFFEKLFVMLSENSSGKSGSFFFHSADGKYMVKTVKKEEFLKLLAILPIYQQFLMDNPNTLLTRYFGLHRMKCYKKKRQVIYDIYIVVMNNVFDLPNPEKLIDIYDLKGSTYKRITEISEIKQGASKKDNNFTKEKKKLKLSEFTKNNLLLQIEKDTKFLAKNNIIDYSLLIGIIFSKDDETISNDLNLKETKDSEDEFLLLRKKRIKSKSDFEMFNQYFTSEDGEVRYYIGIIDTLTNFGLLKKSEFLSKRVFQGKGISCVPPKVYQNRFYEFMYDIF